MYIHRGLNTHTHNTHACSIIQTMHATCSTNHDSWWPRKATHKSHHVIPTTRGISFSSSHFSEQWNTFRSISKEPKSILLVYDHDLASGCNKFNNQWKKHTYYFSADMIAGSDWASIECSNTPRQFTSEGNASYPRNFSPVQVHNPPKVHNDMPKPNLISSHCHTPGP